MKKVLVVNSLRRELEKQDTVLKRSDVTTFTAASSEEVLKIHRAEQVDLIIADLDMPGMGGAGLSSFIRWIEALSKVSIIVACNNEHSAIERCTTSGANAYIVKPLNAQELSGLLQKLLNISPRKRFRVSLRASVKGVFRDNPFLSTTHDISSSGILIETEKALSKGDKIVCSFYLRSSEITTNGEVIWGAMNERNRYNYGIKFLSIDANASQQIAAFVTRHR